MSEELGLGRADPLPVQKLVMKTGKDDPEDQTAAIMRMAAGSKLKVQGNEPEEKEEAPPPKVDLSKDALEKLVGKVFEKITPGIYGPARYKVMTLLWDEKKPLFSIERTSPPSPVTEYEDSCENFLKYHRVFKPHVPEVKAEPKPKKPKTPWSDADSKNS